MLAFQTPALLIRSSVGHFSLHWQVMFNFSGVQPRDRLVSASKRAVSCWGLQTVAGGKHVRRSTVVVASAFNEDTTSRRAALGLLLGGECLHLSQMLPSGRSLSRRRTVFLDGDPSFLRCHICYFGINRQEGHSRCRVVWSVCSRILCIVVSVPRRENCFGNITLTSY